MRQKHFKEPLLCLLRLVFLLNVCGVQGFRNDSDYDGPGETYEDLVVVDTQLGRIMGRRDEAEKTVNAFLGIPFAEPPVGKLRFQPTQPKRPWYPSIYRAFDYSPECLQSTLYTGEDDARTTSEDCLYLNVWQPADVRKRHR